MSQLSFKADLKPTTDNAQFLGDSGHGWKIHRILAPTASSGATFGAGVDGQVLKTNGTTVYWGNDVNTQAVTGVKGNSETNYRTGNVNITAANIGLGNVENTKLSTWTGSSNITTLGTISTGIWNGTAIASGKISTLGIAAGGTGATTAANARTNLGLGTAAQVASGSFALAGHTHSYSPVAGSTSITTLGTITTGTWQGTAIASGYISTLPTSKISGLGAVATAGYGTSATAVSTSSGAGSATTVSRSDHVHSITLATGDSNGQVKIAGSNVSVKGLGTAAYNASGAFALASHGTHVTYGTSATAISSTSGAGTATTVSRSDHVHNISVATGDSNGQVKIAGQNATVKGINTAAYNTSGTFALAGANNTVASSNSTSKLFLVGTTSQSSTGVTGYSNSGLYVSGGILYTNNIRPTSTTSTLLIAGGNGDAKIFIGYPDSALGYRDINFEANDYCFDTLLGASGRMDINTKIYANSGIMLIEGETGTGLTMRYSTSSGTTWEMRSWSDHISKFSIFAKFDFMSFGTNYHNIVTESGYVYDNTARGKSFIDYSLNNAATLYNYNKKGLKLSDTSSITFDPIPGKDATIFMRFGCRDSDFIDMVKGKNTSKFAIKGSGDSSAWNWVNTAGRVGGYTYSTSVADGNNPISQWELAWTEISAYNSTFTTNAGGYCTSGPYVYVQVSIKLAAALSAGSSRNIITSLPYSTETPILLLVAGNDGKFCGILYINTSGTAALRAYVAIAANDNVRICGHYLANSLL